MNDNDLDAVLLRTEEIVPSSGFTSAVMDAVQQEAAMPPPIPFPWRSAMPGLLTCFALVLFLAHRVLHFFPATPARSAFAFSPAQWFSAVSAGLAKNTAYVNLEWLAATILITVLGLGISMRSAD
jgi:hypothetical protein